MSCKNMSFFAGHIPKPKEGHWHEHLHYSLIQSTKDASRNQWEANTWRCFNQWDWYYFIWGSRKFWRKNRRDAGMRRCSVHVWSPLHPGILPGVRHSQLWGESVSGAKQPSTNSHPIGQSLPEEGRAANGVSALCLVVHTVQLGPKWVIFLPFGVKPKLLIFRIVLDE